MRYMTKINQNLKELKMTKGYTQEKVVNKIGLTRQAISSYESGRTQLGIDILMKLAEIYEVDLEDVLYNTSNNNNLKIKKVVITLTSIYWFFFIARGVIRIIGHRCFPITTGYMEQNWEYILLSLM